LSAGAETLLKIALHLVAKAKSPQDQNVLKKKDEDAEEELQLLFFCPLFCWSS
jgi:hypothetical protein